MGMADHRVGRGLRKKMGMTDHCERERQSLSIFVGFGFIFLSVGFMTFFFGFGFIFWFYIFFNIVLTWKIVGASKVLVLYIYIYITFNHKDYLKRKKKHLYHKENKNLLEYLIGERFIPPTKMRLFVGERNLSPIRYCLLWDRQGRPLLPPVRICSILHQGETPPTLAL